MALIPPVNWNVNWFLFLQANADDHLSLVDNGRGNRPVSSKYSYQGGSKELLQSSPSTTSTEELDQIDGGGRRFLKREYNYGNHGQRTKSWPGVQNIKKSGRGQPG